MYLVPKSRHCCQYCPSPLRRGQATSRAVSNDHMVIHGAYEPVRVACSVSFRIFITPRKLRSHGTLDTKALGPTVPVLMFREPGDVSGLLEFCLRVSRASSGAATDQMTQMTAQKRQTLRLPSQTALCLEDTLRLPAEFLHDLVIPHHLGGMITSAWTGLHCRFTELQASDDARTS